MGKIHPSPALVVTSNTPIGDCVRKMRDHQVGSVLVLSASSRPQLVGIFTERDLLKWIDELQHGGHWEKPVVHIMSKPVRTISIDEIDLAAEIMIDHGFRHLPVTGLGGSKDLVGVISMRDLLAERVTGEKRPAPKSVRQKERRVSIIASTKAIPNLERMIRLDTKLAVQKCAIESQDLVSEIEDSCLTILDLDGTEPRLWAALLKRFRASAPHPMVITFSPHGLEPGHVRLLKSIAVPGKIEVFEKPFNVMGFLSRMRALAQLT